MHCYAPNFKEVEGANWFGPVRLSIPLFPPTPLPPSPPPPPTPQKNSLTLAPHPLNPHPPVVKKIHLLQSPHTNPPPIPTPH